MNHTRYEILGLGVCALDVLCEVDELPGPDTKLKVERFVKQGGGLVATAMVAAARLGGRAAFIGALGDDDFARFCIHEFQREGVGTDYITIVPNASVVTAFIMADRSTGGRTIVYSIDEQPATRPEHLRPEMFEGVRVLHVDLHFREAAMRAVELARERGVIVTADIEYPRPGVDELTPLCDYVIVPRKFAEAVTGESDLEASAHAMHRRTGRGVAVTDGTRGSLIVTPDEVFHQPAFRADVVDTTGCGDVYHGAFAFGLAEGFSLRETARIAAASAALKCRALGGRQGIPALSEVQAFLASDPETY